MSIRVSLRCMLRLIRVTMLVFSREGSFLFRLRCNSFSAEFPKVDSSMFKIKPHNLSCNKSFGQLKRQTMLMSGETARYGLTHLGLYSLQKRFIFAIGAEKVKTICL